MYPLKSNILTDMRVDSFFGKDRERMFSSVYIDVIRYPMFKN